MKKTPTGRYPVGYCKPPESGKFQPGQSGNPRGRPKKAKPETGDLIALMREVLVRPRKLMFEGSYRNMSAMEAIAEQLVMHFARRPARHIKHMLPIIELAFDKTPSKDGETGIDYGAQVRAKIEQIAQRLQENEAADQGKKEPIEIDFTKHELEE